MWDEVPPLIPSISTCNWEKGCYHKNPLDSYSNTQIKVLVDTTWSTLHIMEGQSSAFLRYKFFKSVTVEQVLAGSPVITTFVTDTSAVSFPSCQPRYLRVFLRASCHTSEPLAKIILHMHTPAPTQTCYDSKQASKLCKAHLLQRDNDMKRAQIVRLLLCG